MLLTIDIGNTNTVLGVFDGDRVVEHWRIATIPDRTADALAVALSRRAAQLLKVELTRPPRVIGKNTVESLQSGIIYGFAAQVEGIARRMARELSPEDPDKVTTIATGGLAPLVIDEVSVIDAYEPWLTLIGLRLVYEKNAGQTESNLR